MLSLIGEDGIILVFFECTSSRKIGKDFPRKTFAYWVGFRVGEGVLCVGIVVGKIVGKGEGGKGND
jgi:hypothetical protein